MTPEARRALGGGFALTAVSTATAVSADSVRHGIALGIAMLLAALVVTAIVQHGSRNSESA
jgi:hypothetical protein